MVSFLTETYSCCSLPWRLFICAFPQQTLWMNTVCSFYSNQSYSEKYSSSSVISQKHPLTSQRLQLLSFWLAKTFRVIFRYCFSDIRQNNFSLNDIFTFFSIFSIFFFHFTFYVSKRSKISSNGTLKFDFFLYENYNQYKTQLILHAWLHYLQFSVTKIADISPILLLSTKYQTVKICYCLPFYCYFEKLSPSEVTASKSFSWVIFQKTASPFFKRPD